MSAFARLALAAGLAMAAAGAAPAQAAFQTATFDFAISGTGVIGHTPIGTYTSPAMPGFCIGSGSNNCGNLGGLSSSFSFSDVDANTGRITFSFFGSAFPGAGTQFNLTLGAFDVPGDLVVTDVTYNAGSLAGGSFVLSNWNGTTATFTGTGNYSALGGRSVSFNVALAEVPEPASLALLGAALAGLGVARRRRAA